MKVYYFGCVDQPGHFLWDTKFGRVGFDVMRDLIPWSAYIDGGLCPKKEWTEGLAAVNELKGWSALSFWDNSIDKRMGSNSNFIAEGEHTFDEMVAIAKEHFPTIWNRFKFEVVDIEQGRRT